jgi:hypothetical protein
MYQNTSAQNKQKTVRIKLLESSYLDLKPKPQTQRAEFHRQQQAKTGIADKENLFTPTTSIPLQESE